MPRCSSYKREQGEELFRKKKDGRFFGTCNLCSQRKSKKSNMSEPHTRSDKENLDPRCHTAAGEGEDGPEDVSYLGKVPLTAFLETLASREDIKTVTAQVDISILGRALSDREKANAVANKIWDGRGYRFK